MGSNVLLCIVAIGILAGEAMGQERRSAIAVLNPANATGPRGSVVFTETATGLRVTGNITGFSAGRYGFHIHASGDITTCLTTGSHFDINGNTHGGLDSSVRHIGDFGNVVFVGNGTSGTASIDFIDTVATLRGENNILGRAVVLHEGEDDLGLTDHPDSLTTGNAGGRAACGVIGIQSPITSWNAAVAPLSSAVLLTVASLFVFFLHK